MAAESEPIGNDPGAARAEKPPGVPLRRRLLLLAAVGIVPLALMSGFGLYALAQQQRVQAERVGLELSRAVAIGVDAELRSTIAVLESLAPSIAADGDLAAIRGWLRQIHETQPYWATVVLSAPSGVSLVDTRVPGGGPLPAIAERRSFDRTVEARVPTVGNLTAAADGALLFPIRVPVLRDGQLLYVLTAMVSPQKIRDVIARHGVPADWVLSIFDGNGRRVARSRAHAENLGGEAAASLRSLMARKGREGFGLTYTLEGDRIYTPYSQIEPSGWTAALGIPASLIEAPARRSTIAYGGGVLLSIALATLGALWVARTINRPIAGLRAAARALGRREAPLPPETSIQEIREVADALVVAADEHARSEALREDLLVKERAARATAEAADRAKDQFLAVVSHELRTPLNAVYGWARMLRGGLVHGEQQTARALEAIERNASAQVQLVDDLLDMSRVITGKMRLDVRPVDLAAVIEAALDAIRPAAQAKGIRLMSVLDPRAGPIAGDSDRLQQVAWNLLSNAVKFTPKDGRVQVQLQRVNSHVEMIVSDSGEGISPAVLPTVFDRFRQADSSSTRAHTGLGLGLALVKHLVELHGGTVDVHSAGSGQGATFIVQLPLAIADIPPEPIVRVHPTAPAVDALPAGTRLDGLRVLVVDDAPDALDLAALILTRAGALVHRCLSAPEALHELQRWRPDVLVSDIEMPGEDGYSLIRKVRALDPEDGGGIPAIAVSAYGRTQDRIVSLAAGYSMHVPKPVDPGELTTIIASVAARAR